MSIFLLFFTLRIVWCALPCCIFQHLLLLLMGWMISIEWYTQRPNTLPGYLTKMLRDHVRSQATIPRKSPFTCFSCNTYCCFIFLLSQSYTSIFCIFSTNQNASQNSINQSIFSSRVFWQCLKVAKMLLTFWPRLVHFNPFRWKLSHQRKPFEVFSSSLLQNWKTIGKISTLKATLKCIDITSSCYWFIKVLL